MAEMIGSHQETPCCTQQLEEGGGEADITSSRFSEIHRPGSASMQSISFRSVQTEQK